MEIFSKKAIKEITKNKRKLGGKLKVQIQIKGSEILLSGDELNVYAGEKVLEALEKDFPVNTALLLTNENYVLEDIPIKSITNKKNLNLIKARIIGTKGKTLKTISELSDCHISLHENIVSILGPSERIKQVVTAIKSLIRGSKQTNVYYYLEKSRKRVYDEDLGIKE